MRVHEGGISTPLVAHWPERIKQKGAITHQKAYLIDLAPTLYEIAGAEYPETYHEGQAIHTLPGSSMLPIFMGNDREDHEYMFWEHQNNSAIRKGNWKALKKVDDKEWELYNLETDRIESNNVAADHPELVKELNDKWYEWANANKVLPKKNKQ